MKKTFILACALICLAANVRADNSEGRKRDEMEKVNTDKVTPAVSTMQWEFMSTHEEPTADELASFSDSGKFGKRAAYFYDLFKEVYVTKEEVVPGDPTRRTVIRKPEIYNAVRSIEKALSKAMKKRVISQEDSGQQFCHVLEVSLAAIDSDTRSLEEALKDNRKDPEALLAIFQKVELKSIY